MVQGSGFRVQGSGFGASPPASTSHAEFSPVAGCETASQA